MSNGFFQSQHAQYHNNSYSGIYNGQSYTDANSYSAYSQTKGIGDAQRNSIQYERDLSQSGRSEYNTPRVPFDRPSTALGIASHAAFSRTRPTSQSNNLAPGYTTAYQTPDEIISYNHAFVQNNQSHNVAAFQFQSPSTSIIHDTVPRSTYSSLSSSPFDYGAAQLAHSPQYPATPTRPFLCDQCPLSFNRQHDLKRHRETHTGERPFECNGGCGKNFTRKDALRRHQLVKGCGSSID